MYSHQLSMRIGTAQERRRVPTSVKAACSRAHSPTVPAFNGEKDRSLAALVKYTDRRSGS